MKNKLIAFLQYHLLDRPAVVGLSGGVDSTVVAYLLAQAVGSHRVQGLIMPSLTTQPQDTKDAQMVAKLLDISTTHIPIDSLLEAYQTASPDYQPTMALANLKARIRMSLLYGRSNAIGGLVVGTGNKSELAVGYFTKYGDGGVDLLPLGDLYKFEVRELAISLNVPEHIITKSPTAGLVLNQTDEEDLGMTYKELDAILLAIEHNASLDEFDQQKVKHVQQLHIDAKHKLVLPPIAIQA